MRTETIQLYNFEELSEASKEKAIEDYREHNYMDYEWWDWLHEEFHEKLKEIGVSCKDFSWELDRGRNFEMNNPIIFDEKLFLKSAGFQKELILCSLDEFGIGSIDVNEYGNVNFLVYDNEDMERAEEIFGKDIEEKLGDYINNITNGFFERLEKEYEYMGSDEFIREELINNEWEFTVEGKRR